MQCRMARAALDWTTRQLAQTADVPARQLQGFLAGSGTMSPAAIKRIRAVFDEAGLVFDLDAGVGPGLRLKDTEKASPIVDRQRPTGPATDVIERMEAEIAAGRQKRKL